MKIAISGAHNTGKTTLIDSLAHSLPGYSVLEEPYYQLAAEGHIFPELPSLEDFELQLERSIESIPERDGDCLFDRCPYDLMAYLLTHEDSYRFQSSSWLGRVEEAAQSLDLIVLVPIEKPDRILDSGSDNSELRLRIDEYLVEIVLNDKWSFEVPAFEVTGSIEERVQKVIANL